MHLGRAMTSGRAPMPLRLDGMGSYDQGRRGPRVKLQRLDRIGQMGEAVRIRSAEGGDQAARHHSPVYAPPGKDGAVRPVRREEAEMDGVPAKLIDEALPQRAFTVMRVARMERVLSACGDAGKLATFQIRILFRQNAGWQGSVTWLGRDQTESFRSALERAFLMDSALQDRDG